MPRSTLIICTSVLVMACVGCVSDVSSSDQYRELIGNTVHLQRGQVLWRNPSGEAKLAPYEIESDMGAYTSHERVAEIGPDSPLHLAKVKRRKYLISSPEHRYKDFAIVNLRHPLGTEQIKAEVAVAKLALE